MEKIFWMLLGLKLFRYLLPWVLGFLVSLLVLSLAPLSPLAGLFLAVVLTTWIAWAIEVKVLRAFERIVPRARDMRDMYDSRRINRRNRNWR